MDGQERLRWRHSRQHPRPFFFPVLGPSGAELTRIGHPGAPNHDHHLSVWFAHADVSGVNFWSNTSDATIVQKQWLAYEDGEDEAMMGVLLHWQDGHDPRPLLEQQLLVSFRPAPDNAQETLIELDSTFTPTSEMLQFGATNFGFLAVRVARSISAYFGGGQLTNDQGIQGEPKLFGKRSRWMDYSGPVGPPARDAAERPETADGPEKSDQQTTEGITYFDHPDNMHHPAHWHVREDGWMGAAPGMKEPILTTKPNPLRLRFLIHAHSGGADQARAEKTWTAFSKQPPMKIVSGRSLKVRHRHMVIQREV